MRDTAERVSRASDVLGGRSYEQGRAELLHDSRVGQPPELGSIVTRGAERHGKCVTPQRGRVSRVTLVLNDMYGRL